MAEAVAGRPPIRNSGRMYLVLATGFAVLAGLLAFAALRDSDGGSSSTTTAQTLSRVVAREDIPARTRITANLLTVEAIPIEAALDSAYASETSVVGLVTRYPIAANEQISPLKVGATIDADVETDAGLSFVVPEGMRAVAISVTEASVVGGLVVAGDHVDVIALLDEDLAGIEKAVTVLQNVEVLSVAQVAQEAVPPPASGETEPAAEDAGTTSESRGVRPVEVEPQPSARTVTLAVSQQDAQTLALADQHMTLWLSLRAFDDDTTVPLEDSDLLPLGVLQPALRN